MTPNNNNARELVLKLPKLHPKQRLAFSTEATEVLYGGATRGGKALDINTLVFTPSGFKRIIDLQVGDTVFDEQGCPCEVMFQTGEQYNRECFELEFSDGSKIVADAEHQWVTLTQRERAEVYRRTDEFRAKRRAQRQKRGKGKRPDLAKYNQDREYSYKVPPTGRVRTTLDIAESLGEGRCNHSIENTQALELPVKELLIDPYVLGLWLGDGTATSGGFTTNDPETVAAIRLHYPVKKTSYKYGYGIHKIKADLQKLGVLGNKHIPRDYLFGSKEQRLALLQGLMDSDGYCDSRGQCEFYTCNKQLAEDVRFLILSLGAKATIRVGRAKLRGKDCGSKYRIKFMLAYPAFRLERKLQRQKERGFSPNVNRRFIKKCTPVKTRPVCCIQVDSPSEMYLAGETLIPTHNTFFTKYSLIRWCYEIPGLQCVIYRLNFDDVVNNYMKGRDSFPNLLADWVDAGLVTVTQTEVRFNFNGSRIELRHCADERAQSKGQGNPIHVLVFEEAAQILETNMRFLRGWVTMDEEMKARVPEKWKGRFPKIIYTSNPFGQSAGYLRRGFVKAAPPMQLFTAPISDGGFQRIYIPARVEDNPSEDKEDVIRRISGIGDEALVDALLNENWDAPVGDFIRQWNESKHRVDDFEPPDYWFKWRSFDWGSSEPFAVYWWCISDGEPFTDQLGRVRQFPRGARIAYREWYGCHPVDQKAGLEMLNVDIAKGILERTHEMTSGLTLTDNKPFQPGGGKLAATEFMEAGVLLTQGNTRRELGWKFMKDLLKGQTWIDKDGQEQSIPMLYFVRSCKYAAEYIPTLQRHKSKMEDAVEDGEATHTCDAIRYGVFTKPPISDKPKEPGDIEWGNPSSQTVADLVKSLKKEHLNSSAR